MLLPVDRRSGELSAALERHGARVRVAPALTIVPHVDDEELIAQTRTLVDDPPDVVVATTGVGFRAWMETADEAGLHDALAPVLDAARIVARGPKARGSIQQAGFDADWVAESETSAELRDFLVAEGVDGLHVAVQHHGSGADGLDEAFEAAGARVTSLTIYRWGPPPDPEVVARRRSRSRAERSTPCCSPRRPRPANGSSPPSGQTRSKEWHPVPRGGRCSSPPSVPSPRGP